MLRHPSRLLAITALLLTAACAGDDEPTTPRDTATDAADTAATDVDDGGDAATEVRADAADVVDGAGPTSITFTLTNANPGGLSRWVQIVDGQGTPSWYGVLPAGGTEFIRVHDACTVCACDDRGCEPCVPEPEVLELAPGESVTGAWDGSTFAIDPDGFCKQPGRVDGGAFSVELAWSPEPPDEDGTLPVGTLSRTRLSFELGIDAEVRYDIEALAAQ